LTSRIIRRCHGFVDYYCQFIPIPLKLIVRLDLFLKTSRLVKRRTIARAMCEKGKVFVNGLQAKPAKEVRQGDRITMKFASRIIDLEVISTLFALSRKILPEELYRVVSETRLNKDRDLWNENLS
jgi:ribosomal 50S subunit-recycling heat shock protein